MLRVSDVGFRFFWFSVLDLSFNACGLGSRVWSLVLRV